MANGFLDFHTNCSVSLFFYLVCNLACFLCCVYIYENKTIFSLCCLALGTNCLFRTVFLKTPNFSVLFYPNININFWTKLSALNFALFRFTLYRYHYIQCVQEEILWNKFSLKKTNVVLNFLKANYNNWDHNNTIVWSLIK